MFSSIRTLMKNLAIGLAVSCTILCATTNALADKLHLKDGRVLEGTVVREGNGFVFFKVKVGGIQKEELFTNDQILKIERDDPKPKTDENIKKEEEQAKKPEAKKEEKTHSGATRVCILNFGPPSDWQGSAGDMVGVQVSSEGFRKAIPLLEKAKIDVVVIRINSGGGYLNELAKFHQVFEKEYKPRFRTVAWIESGISAACMSPWVIEEFYFMSKGSLGANTGWGGRLVAVKGIQLEMVLHQMEEASALGKKDPKIMRAMQIQEPLSADIDENGVVYWRQDDQGQILLNPKGQVYTMNAQDAIRTKFAKGIADTREELAKALGLQEVEWAGKEASDFIDKNIRENDMVEKRNQVTLQKYLDAIGLAQQLQDKERRGQQLAIAKRLLAELRRMIQVNPTFEFHLGIPPEWFTEQEELIKRLSQGP